MIGSENIKYSLKNLAARKSRSFLTVLSIFIGIMTIFIFISFGLGLYNYINTLAAESGADKIYVQPRGIGAPGVDSTVIFGQADLDTIDKTKGVKETLAFYMNVGEIEDKNKKRYVFISGYEPSTTSNKLLIELYGVDLLEGRMLKESDNGKIIVGYNYILPDKVLEKPVDIGDKLTINGKVFEIIGIFESIGNPQDDSNIMMNEEDFKSLYSDKKLSYAAIFIRVNNIQDIDSVADHINKDLRNARGQEEGKEDFFVQTFQDVIEQFSTALNIIIGFIILIALVSVVVSAVNTANTMITSVLERTNEIGVMKAIGAKSSTIRNIFLFESSFLGFVAGLIGVFLGWVFASIAGNILSNLGWGFLQPLFTWQLFIGLILFATMVGTLSGAAVAIQASRQNAVDALRYE